MWNRLALREEDVEDIQAVPNHVMLAGSRLLLGVLLHSPSPHGRRNPER